MDKKRKKPFQIDLSEWRLWIKSSNNNCQDIKDGIYIEARNASSKFYMAVLSLIASKHAEPNCPEYVDIDTIAKDIDLYAYLYDLAKEGHPKNTRSMIDSMLRNSRSINIAPSRTYWVYDKDLARIKSAGHRAQSIRTALASLFSSPTSKDKGRLLLGIGFKDLGIKPSAETVGVIPLSKDTKAKLQAAYDKEQSRKQRLRANEAVDIFNETRRKYLADLRNELEHAVEDNSEGTLRISKIADTHLRKERSIERGLSIRDTGKHILINELLSVEEDRVIVLSGTSGLGKTTALRQLTWQACKTNLRNAEHPLPIYLNCHSSLMGQLITSLNKFTSETLDEYDVRNILKTTLCTIFIDGYDDLKLPDSTDPVELRNIITMSAKSRFVITSRDTREPQLSRQTVYYVLPPENPAEHLSIHGISHDVARRVISILERINALEVLSTPMFLWFVALLLRKHPKADIPHAPGALMKTVIDRHFIPAMLKKQGVIELGFSEETADDITGGLSALAFRMIYESKIEFDRKRVIRTYHSYFKHEKLNDSGGWARKLFSATTYQGFLKKTAEGHYVFFHNMFRDYFAACHIEEHWDNKKVGCTAKQLVEWLKWDYPLSLMCGFADAATQRNCITEASAVDVALGVDLCLASACYSMNRSISRITVDAIFEMCCTGSISIESTVVLLCRLQSADAVELLHLLLDFQVNRCRNGFATELNIERSFVILNVLSMDTPPDLVDRHRIEACKGVHEMIDFGIENFQERKGKAPLYTRFGKKHIDMLSDFLDPAMSPHGSDIPARLAALAMTAKDALRQTEQDMAARGAASKPETNNPMLAAGVLALNGHLLLLHKSTPDFEQKVFPWLLLCLEFLATYGRDRAFSDLLDGFMKAAAHSESQASIQAKHIADYLLAKTGKRFGGSLSKATLLFGLRGSHLLNIQRELETQKDTPAFIIGILKDEAVQKSLDHL